MVKLRKLSILLILALFVLLAACSGEPEAPVSTPVATRPVAAAATATSVPTSTDEPAPAATATSAPAEAAPADGEWYAAIDPAFNFAPCEPDGQFPDVSEEEIAEWEESRVGFLPPDEFISTWLDPLVGAEAHAYRTVYAYHDDAGYVEGELSLDIRGQHAGIPLDPPDDFDELFFATVSAFFSTNHYLVTDLDSGRVREFVSGEEGVWLREDGAGWIHFSPGLSPTMGSGYDALAPSNLALMAIGAGSPSPLMALAETIGDREVIHYCWVPGDADFLDDGHVLEAGAFLIHDFFYGPATLLQHAELHAWVSAEDETLQRMAITGEHTSDIFFNSSVEHEPPHDFFVWSELLPADAAPLAEPDAGDIELAFTPADEAMADADQALPLPPDAAPVDPDRLDTVLEVEASEFDENPYPFTPRELVGNEQKALSSALDAFDLNMNAADFGVYETSMTTAELLAFYAEEMPAAGWALDSASLVTGRTAVVLHYAGAGDAGALLILREGEPGRSLIYTLEPRTVEGDWRRFNAFNSPLGEIEAMSLDNQGRAWFFSDGELHIYDIAADAWSTHSLPADRPEDVHALAVSAHGDQVLLSFFTNGLYYFDGATWERPLESYFFSLGFLPDGTPWAEASSGGADYVEGFWRYDGGAWNLVEAVRACAGAGVFGMIRGDAEGRLWASRSSSTGDIVPVVPVVPGVWLIEGEECRQIFTSSWGVDAIVPTSQGSAWVSEAEMGIVELDDQGEIVRELENAPAMLDLKPVAVGPDGSLWLTAEEGLLRYTPDGEWVNYALPGAVGYFGPDVVLFDQAGRLWVAGDGWVAYLLPEG